MTICGHPPIAQSDFAAKRLISSMTGSLSNMLNTEFLGIRCRLIELAAALDRIDRADGSAADDPRMAQIRRSLQILAGDGPDRAEQVQMVFSLPYEEGLGIRD
jgi:hypothetical protein